MNTKFYACLLALGTFASAVLLSLTPVSAQNGNGSNSGNNIQPIPGGNGSNTTNNVQPIPGGNGSNTTNNATTGQPVVVNISAPALANVNAVLGQVLAANPQAFAAVITPAALVPPGASQSVSDAGAALASAVAALNGGNITGVQLNAAIEAYNAYATALVESVGGEQAIAFLSSAGGVKSADGTSAPSLRSQLLKLVQAANS